MSLDFNGTTSIVTSAANSAVDNLSALSCAAWVNLDGSGEGNSGRLFDKIGAINAGWAFFCTTTNTLIFVGNHSTTQLNRFAADNSAPTGQWLHVAATWDGSTTAANAKIYVNGSEVSYKSAQNGAGTRPDDSATPLYIGNRGALDRTLDGRMAEPCVWNIALTAADIASAAKAVSHAKIRPQHIVDHRQFIRDGRPWKGGANTDSNVTAATHPRIYH